MRTVRLTSSVVAGLLLVGCSSAPTGDAAPPATPPPEVTASPDAAPTTGPSSAAPRDDAAAELLAFSGRQLSGGTFDGAAVTGDVVIWFWAPW